MNRFFTTPITHTLLPLWQCCFVGEDEQEILQLLDTLAPDGMALCAEEDGQLVCQGLLLLCSVGDYYGYYIYALCTAPEKQGQGYMRAFLRAAEALRDENGLDFLTLIPANQQLRATYLRLGFTQELPLSASETAADCYLYLPATGLELPFDGDYERLYLQSARNVGYATFCAALDSVQAETDIFYTSTGFRVRSKHTPAYCFTADKAILPACVRHDGVTALAMPRAGITLPNTLPIDPLPR